MRLPKTPLTYLLWHVPSNVVSSEELQDKGVQQLVLALITIIDWEYKKWLPIIDWFNNRSRLWIYEDRRRSDVVAYHQLLWVQEMNCYKALPNPFEPSCCLLFCPGNPWMCLWCFHPYIRSWCMTSMLYIRINTSLYGSSHSAYLWVQLCISL
jgi:hypothetical protein